jgi:hypothetical protein
MLLCYIRSMASSSSSERRASYEEEACVECKGPCVWVCPKCGDSDDNGYHGRPCDDCSVGYCTGCLLARLYETDRSEEEVDYRRYKYPRWIDSDEYTYFCDSCDDQAMREDRICVKCDAMKFSEQHEDKPSMCQKCAKTHCAGCFCEVEDCDCKGREKCEECERMEDIWCCDCQISLKLIIAPLPIHEALHSIIIDYIHR